MPPDNLLAQLDENQKQVATYFSGPLCVAAGAGTGKTRAITYRLAYAVEQQIYRPQHILAVTFTSRAAGEMRARLRTLGVGQITARTFHSAALAQLRYFWPQAIGGYVPEIKENKFALVAGAATQLGLPTDLPSVKDFAQEIEWSKVSLITPADYPDQARQNGREGIGGQSPEKLAELITAYEEVKCERGVIDFEDIILTLIGMLRDRKDIRDLVRARYRHFVVDEYQDISPMQHRLLQLWLGDSRDICVVGDVSQTIYSFAGASAAYLANFAREFPTAKRLVLNKNYRSTAPVISLANRISSVESLPGSVSLEAIRPDSGQVYWKKYRDASAEAAGVAEKITALLRAGEAPANIAVLYRINAQSAVFENALREAGIPYVVKGNVRFFERREIKEAMISLRAEAKTAGDQPLPQFLDAAFYNLGWRPEPPAQQGAAREKWESLRALAEIGRQIWESRRGSVADFLAELAERAEYQYDPQLQSVVLSTIHAAKGLEWRQVFLAGVQEGLLPLTHAGSEEEITEERRLLYVGITRARDNLYISYAEKNGSDRGNCSRFLADIWLRSTNARQVRPTASAVATPLSPAAEKLFQSLRAWRKETAQKTGRAEYQILSDTSLRQISKQQPQNLFELSQVAGIGKKRLATYGVEILHLLNSLDS
ncbi:ATP-dependent DNA helicase UvrD2 [Arcanobacterium urinimassiliense]|uniref:ATP-dependent DNA helicase UvrD2 n=1 Tax=Arcanobacterium urinimassiliense TaxID=1871014 RepID=UPI00093F37FE|nr:ATP-dependent DNA helicase UvrD2 [Arcanobacterium urinimassiliense]